MLEVASENAINIENLLAAYEGESNAHAKYTAFAVKADADGWHVPNRFTPPITPASSSSWVARQSAKFIRSKSNPPLKT